MLLKNRLLLKVVFFSSKIALHELYLGSHHWMGKITSTCYRHTFLQGEPRPALVSSSSLSMHEVARRSNDISGNINRCTLWRIVMVLLQLKGDFKPLLNRRVRLSLDSSRQSGCTKALWLGVQLAPKCFLLVSNSSTE